MKLWEVTRREQNMAQEMNKGKEGSRQNTLEIEKRENYDEVFPAYSPVLRGRKKRILTDSMRMKTPMGTPVTRGVDTPGPLGTKNVEPVNKNREKDSKRKEIKEIETHKEINRERGIW